MVQILSFYCRYFSEGTWCANNANRRKINARAQLFKTNDVDSERIVNTLIIKYTIYANIFAEKKMWVAFALAKVTHIVFQQRYMWNRYCTYYNS